MGLYFCPFVALIDLLGCYMVRATVRGDFPIPTNIASVNLVMGCSKVFFHYCNSCPGVLMLYNPNVDPIANYH